VRFGGYALALWLIDPSSHGRPAGGRPPALTSDPRLWWAAGFLVLEAVLIAARARTDRGAEVRAGKPAFRTRAGLALLGVLLAFALAEVFLRVAGIPPPAVPSTADFDRERIPDVRNPLGLRESWSSVPPRVPGQVRVALLGDSFVYGEGVPREQAMPAALEAVLRRRHPGRSFAVFNLGVPDNDTRQEAARYRQLHDVLDADVLVLVVYLNDFTRANPAYTLHDIYGAGEERGFFSRSSWLFAHLWSRVRLFLMRERSIAWYRSSALADFGGEFVAMGRELLALRDFCESRGVRFTMAFFPWLYSLKDYPVPELHANIERFARVNHLPFLDLLPTFRGRDDEPLRVSRANEHPSALAHTMAAAALADFIDPYLKVKEPRPRAAPGSAREGRDGPGVRER